MLKDEIEKLRKEDPLAVAEHITGESYKESGLTTSLGLALHMEKSQQMHALMQMTDDTSYRSSMADHMRIATDLGFDVVYQESHFVTRSQCEDTYYVHWHPDGILMECDSYRGTSRNTARIYYSLAGDVNVLWKVISSGHTAPDGDEWVLVGDHDVRECLRHKIGLLRDAGTFRSTWLESPNLWMHPYWEDELLGKWDYKSPVWEAARARRFEALPEHVQLAIRGTK